MFRTRRLRAGRGVRLGKVVWNVVLLSFDDGFTFVADRGRNRQRCCRGDALVAHDVLLKFDEIEPGCFAPFCLSYYLVLLCYSKKLRRLPFPFHLLNRMPKFAFSSSFMKALCMILAF